MSVSALMNDDVLILTLDDPGRRNPLSVAVRRDLTAALAEAEANEAVRAVVLTGAGGHFCSGGDLAAQKKLDPLAARDRMAIAAELIRRMVRYPKPIIAAVEGWAAGAGFSLALACDEIVAGETARFAASFARVGLIPDLGMMATLPARVGPAVARRLMLAPEPLGADEARALGIVDEIVPAGEALRRAAGRGRAAAERAPLAQACMKDFFARAVDDALRYEIEIQPFLLASADAAEGRAAFFEKRKPVFRGA
ncbi:MAG: enoyl-CoA hydratase/isomerase family protein [Pseudochelatococcus sp.]|jgi:2-(1,2-epoxy-1,2-dihydrophenyl)acetyl-CoA isomerase|uniref:enoyl-CoA hydratase/isomerase family protein n=1 Tax=Pseudochelatococcus sp. TaxID=2020869 RepID=UPI003D8F0E19